MFAFDIIDGRARNAVPCGRLFYDAERDEWGIQIAEGAGPEEVPFLFSSFVERGERAIGPAWARRWVAERVVPPGRQNLGEVLRANGLREYSEFALLAIGKGACSQDYFVLRGPFPVDDDGEILDDRRQLRQSIGRAVAEARREGPGGSGRRQPRGARSRQHHLRSSGGCGLRLGNVCGSDAGAGGGVQWRA